ncbi:MAG: ubiquitin-like domain-containing protein [Paenibacillaceae bacterium]
MGTIQLDGTHVKRSSSMTFALRWKHERVRLIAIIALISSALLFMFFMLLYGTAIKSVSVVLDGKEIPMLTRESDLQHLLDEQAISVGEHDRVSTQLDASIKNGERITIDTTAPIQLTADGKTKTMYTTGKTVESALQDLSIILGSEDKVYPSLSSEVSDYAPIKVVRVTKEQENQTVSIAFTTEQKIDSTLPKGKEKILQEGKPGTKLIQKQNIYEDGTLVATKVVNEVVQKVSVNKLVAIGTKKPTVVKLSANSPEVSNVTKSGIEFGYKQIINNVTLTAYSDDFASTGKESDDPQSGITYSGTTVKEGRTIAVDKNVIPIGWWVYIEGIGLRRAEDTGSAVKGNKIDVYYESSEYANKFGLKRGYTVYVIGPKKPSSE